MLLSQIYKQDSLWTFLSIDFLLFIKQIILKKQIRNIKNKILIYFHMKLEKKYLFKDFIKWLINWFNFACWLPFIVKINELTTKLVLIV